MSINNVNISGYITRNSELDKTPNGHSILKFSVAVNEKRSNSNGGWSDYTHFFNCICFGKRADSLYRWLTKGTKVSIHGKLNYSSWEDKETHQKHSRINIVVNDIDFTTKQPRSKDDVPQQSKQELQNNYVTAYTENDIPF